jgi:hypothetical protein
MFSLQSEGDDQQGSRYSVIPQIQKVCEVVDGFIYVANAEAHKSKHSIFYFFKNYIFFVKQKNCVILVTWQFCHYNFLTISLLTSGFSNPDMHCDHMGAC